LAADAKSAVPHRRVVMKRLLRLLVASALVAGLMTLPAHASPGDLYVDGTLGADSPTCGAMSSPCRSIQQAINNASAGDTIHVAAGTYPESAPGPLTVNKTLTLLGAQFGNDARMRAGLESAITDSQGTYIGADNVVVDGFTIEDSTNTGYTGYGIWMGCHAGTQILNDIFQDNIVGLGLTNPNGAEVVIRQNVFRNNNQSGGASGTGIYTDQFVSCGKAVKDVLVVDNDFIGNDNSGIDISNTDPNTGVSGLDVSQNTFAANGRALDLYNTHMSSVHDNSISGNTLATSAAIHIFQSTTDLSIKHNDFTSGDGDAIRLSFDDACYGCSDLTGLSSNVVINENNIGTVGSASFLRDGLRVDQNGHRGTVNAECNWWGSETGPTNTNNAGGTGEEVEGDADFTPWLLAPWPEGACFGGLPPTPGKVTGGGQITGDPVFSSTGDLLSVPAIVPSLAGPQSQATFGFVVTCCPAKGNLEYDDHPMDVRIKAQSISRLFISSPGTSCPATPGSMHATFNGKANVIRSTGTTTEDFTVDVDDCGEPGTADTFKIKTTTYSNGPNALIGGNIQIHK
jgi:Protein of unknown function (DUF1565)